MERRTSKIRCYSDQLEAQTHNAANSSAPGSGGSKPHMPVQVPNFLAPSRVLFGGRPCNNSAMLLGVYIRAPNFENSQIQSQMQDMHQTSTLSFKLSSTDPTCAL